MTVNERRFPTNNNCIGKTKYENATTMIKYFHIFVGTTMLLNVPLSYFSLKLGLPPQSTMIISTIVSAITLFIRLYFIKILLGFKMKEYLNEVVKFNIIITSIAIIIPCYVYYQLNQSIISFFVVCFTCVLTSFFTIVFIGLKRNERKQVFNIIANRIPFLK